MTMEQYRKEISQIPLLTPDEEYQHATKALAGDLASRELLIKSNLRYVVT